MSGLVTTSEATEIREEVVKETNVKADIAALLYWVRKRDEAVVVKLVDFRKGVS